MKIKIGGRKAVHPENVILLEGDSNYSHVHLKNGAVLTVATTLKILEERFKGGNFYRAHKKYLLNIKEVKNCINYTVKLKNKKEAIVSRRRKEGLEKLLKAKETLKIVLY